MLFKELLDRKYNSLWSEFEKLYNLVIDNQTHEGDLLLVRLNAFYNPEVKNGTISKLKIRICLARIQKVMQNLSITIS